MMTNSFLLLWLTNAVALGVTAWLLSGVHITSLFALATAALVLGFVNAIVRPLLLMVTLPFTMLTLGLFYFVVNGAAFGLAAALVPGFSVASFFSAVLGAFLTGLVSWLIGMVSTRRRTVSDRSTIVEVHQHHDGRWGL